MKLVRLRFIAVLMVICFGYCMTGCNAQNEGSIADSAEESVTEAQGTSAQSDVSTTEDIEEGVGTDMTHGNAAKIAADIKIGWNLGNTLDCYDVTWAVKDHETAWGNPKTTKEMIDTVKAAGFNAVRIPVSWTDHITEDGTIDKDWMDRVQEVVDYSMDNDLYTIINVHHDDYTWLNPTCSDEAAVKEKLVKIWEQIAERFRDYDTKLLFEGMNEPRVVGSTYEWVGGTAEEREVVNRLLQAFVDTVRASGGRNSARTLIVTTYAASITGEAVNALELPDDNNLIVSIHSYAPWKFTTLEFPEETDFTDSGKAEIDKGLDFLYGTFVFNGIPVFICEFGAENKDNAEERAEYFSYYVEAAAERGIPCFIWDNGKEDGYGLLNRRDCTWYDESLIDSLMAAVS